MPSTPSAIRPVEATSSSAWRNKRIVVAGLLAERDRVLAERPVEALAALGRQIVAEIFVKDDRLVDRRSAAARRRRVSSALTPGKLVAALDDQSPCRRGRPAARASAAMMLPRACSVQSARGSTIPPVVSELDGHVGPQHEQFVIALRRGELDVGILPRSGRTADAATLAAKRQRYPELPHANSPGARPRPPVRATCLSFPERQIKDRKSQAY